MSDEQLSPVEDLAGLVIIGVRRVLFEFRGQLDTSVGALELRLSEGRTLLLDSGPDGESLRALAHPWEDPFRPDRLTPENLDFIAKSGKWTAVDVSGDDAYHQLVGARILRVVPHLNEAAKPVGLTIHSDRGVLTAQVEADDLRVSVE